MPPTHAVTRLRTRARRRVLVSRSRPFQGHSPDFAKRQSAPGALKTAPTKVWFREVEGVCALLRKAPRQAPGFAKYLCPGSFSRLRETRSSEPELTKPCVRALSRGSGFAKYTDSGPFARLPETRAWPERGAECPGGSRVSRSGGGSHPGEDGSPASDPVSRSAAPFDYRLDFAKPGDGPSVAQRAPARVGFREVGRDCTRPLTPRWAALFSRSGHRAPRWGKGPRAGVARWGETLVCNTDIGRSRGEPQKLKILV